MIGPLLALALQATAPGDAIGDILSSPAPATQAGPPPSPPPSQYIRPAPQYALPPPPAPPLATVPPPGAPLEERASRYASDVRSTFQARESRQGDLDGRWTLSDADGKGLYVLQFADPGPGRGPVEGAWRDLAHEGAPDATGFLDAADRSGPSLTLNFGKLTVTLTQGADGRWTGAARVAGQSQPVTMTRS